LSEFINPQGEHRMNEIQKVKAPNRDEVELLGATFEAGQPQGAEMGKWNQKLANRDEKIKYLQTGMRYFYEAEGFGSEKRKNPA
jgi:hypothetical protein